MTSQQPPEGLSADDMQLLAGAEESLLREFPNTRAALGRAIALLNAARSTSPAPIPGEGSCFECGHELHAPFCPACNPEMVSQPAKAGEREQVAEAGARALLDQGGIACASEWPEVENVLYALLSALAEARSEVERFKLMRHDMAVSCEKEASRADGLAAQLEVAREALKPFARIAYNYIEGDYGFRIESTRSPPYSFGRLDVDRARQALSMSILRGDKGCSLGAIEAPACGSPADSQTAGGAE